MKAELKQKPQQILDFIKAYRDEHDYPPSLREIGGATGIASTSHVTYYLDQLEEKGYIARDNRISRGIQLLGAAEPFAHAAEEVVSVPYLGYIVASAPISVEPLPGDETVEISRALFGRDTSDLFALTVQGNSMIDALINDGDMVIIRQQERVENGQMAAVWLDDPGETTLKKLYYEGNQVRLQPANPTMEPFYEPAENVRVQGKVVMVIRQMG
ncbi:MAG: transcriptional repressor LexA [Anaerolineae bacterium]|nr:transcriptional repressor LexA [Anaerolineae bacterium]